MNAKLNIGTSWKRVGSVTLGPTEEREKEVPKRMG
jgi:hypothetical protein